jgi:uncharacterized protein YbjT (DUF2867 family)
MTDDPRLGAYLARQGDRQRSGSFPFFDVARRRGVPYAKELAHADLLDAQGGPGNADLTRSLWYLETERVWLAEQMRRGGPAPPPPQEGLTVDPRDILDLRERVAVCADFTPAERNLILSALRLCETEHLNRL